MQHDVCEGVCMCVCVHACNVYACMCNEWVCVNTMLYTIRCSRSGTCSNCCYCMVSPCNTKTAAWYSYTCMHRRMFTTHTLQCVTHMYYVRLRQYTWKHGVNTIHEYTDDQILGWHRHVPLSPTPKHIHTCVYKHGDCELVWYTVCDIEIWATSILSLNNSWGCHPNSNYLLSSVVVTLW